MTMYVDSCMVIFRNEDFQITSTGTVIKHEHCVGEHFYAMTTAADLLQTKSIEISQDHHVPNNKISKFQCFIKLTSIDCHKLFPADLILMWKCKNLDRKIKKLFGEEWTFDDKGDAKRRPEKVKNYLSWFCLLKIKSPDEVSSTPSMQSMSLPKKMMLVSPGVPVICKSSPFDENFSQIFGSCVSRGIVCAVDNKMHPTIFITDARCLPEAKGALILQIPNGFEINKFIPTNALMGFAIAPLCWKNNELIGMTICASVDTTISSVLQIIKGLKWNKGTADMHWLADVEDIFHKIYPSSPSSISNDLIGVATLVPFIECGSSFGSGVLVVRRGGTVYIVTCRHVIKDHKTKAAIHTKLFNTWYRSKLVYEAPISTEFDFALLSITIDQKLDDELRDVDIHGDWMVEYAEEEEHKEGMQVISKGHGLFGSDSDIKMVVSEGVVSKVCHTPNYNNSPNTPILLHVTAHVHKGASGGALIQRNNGRFLGLLVNNIRDETLNISMTDVAFCIPACLFMRNIKKYASSMIRNDLTSLNFINEDFNQLWRLCTISNTLAKL